MASLGQELKQEREKRGISLEEISRVTRINLRFLQAIENDDFELLPGGFFDKAFLRAYLRYLGLDEKAIMNRYESFYRQKEGLLNKKVTRMERPRRPFASASIFLAIFLLAAGFGFLYLVFQLRPKPEPSITRATIVEPAILPPAVTEKEEKSAPPLNEINLKISFQERTWIQVYVDGSIKLDGIKNPGDTFETTATKELLIHLGNAGGITYTLNGSKGKSLGRSGAVVKNIRITLENIKDYLEPQLPLDSSLPHSAINYP